MTTVTFTEDELRALEAALDAASYAADPDLEDEQRADVHAVKAAIARARGTERDQESPADPLTKNEAAATLASLGLEASMRITRMRLVADVERDIFADTSVSDQIIDALRSLQDQADRFYRELSQAVVA
jgi:hypothetical protein